MFGVRYFQRRGREFNKGKDRYSRDLDNRYGLPLELGNLGGDSHLTQWEQWDSEGC